MNEQNLKTIQNSKLFQHINPKEIKGLLTCLSVYKMNYGKGEYIYHIGETTTKIGMVLSGSLHLTKEDYWGNCSILAKVLPGELFGEAYACLQTESVTVNCIAPEQTCVLFFDVTKIISVCSCACSFHSRLIMNLLMELANKNIQLTQKLDHMARRTTREKILSYLSSQAQTCNSNQFLIPFNRQQLADYLFVDRSALSSELSKLKAEGFLDFKKNSFTLYDRQ